MSELKQEIFNAECAVAAAKLVVRQSQESLMLAQETLEVLKLRSARMTNENVVDTRTLLNG
jgi:hypothetical protein